MTDRYTYFCKENDNAIRMVLDDYNKTKINEIEIGCFDAPSDGWSVVGFDDLVNALECMGYTIQKAGE